jgi:hypothetical protein
VGQFQVGGSAAIPGGQSSGLHAVQPAVVVREVVLIGRVEDVKFLIETEFRQPLRRAGVRTVVLGGGPILVLTPRGPSIVDDDLCQGWHPGISPFRATRGRPSIILR